MQTSIARESDEHERSKCVENHSLASAIQSWLFFGIASEALGRNVKHEEFADLDPHRSHLSIDLRVPRWYWRELKARWNELYGSLPASEFKARKARLEEVHESLHEVITKTDILMNDKDDDELAGILLSLQMLLYLVACVLDFGLDPSWCSKLHGFTDVINITIMINV